MISVVIPTYNTALLVERSVRSVLRQSCQDFEILIVDDGSSDQTLAVVRAITDERIRIFQQPCNQGPAAARNRGLQEARGKYTAYLDGDDFWEPDFLRETGAFLEAHPEAVAVSVRQCHKIPGKEPVFVPVDEAGDRPVVLADFFDFWARFNHVCTGSVLFRTDAARKLGGQREDLRICEDLEFWAMLAGEGAWGFIPELLFTSDGGIVTQKQGWLAKNRKRWASAVPVAEWEKRLAGRIPDAMQAGYRRVRGRVAGNLCYALLLSGRRETARREVLRNGVDFPETRLNKLMRRAAASRPVWFAVSRLLRLREVLR